MFQIKARPCGLFEPVRRLDGQLPEIHYNPPEAAKQLRLSGDIQRREVRLARIAFRELVVRDEDGERQARKRGLASGASTFQRPVD